MYPLYSEMLSWERRAELLRQAEYVRLLSTIERQQKHQLPLYRWWAYNIGRSLVKWSLQLGPVLRKVFNHSCST